MQCGIHANSHNTEQLACCSYYLVSIYGWGIDFDNPLDGGITHTPQLWTTTELAGAHQSYSYPTWTISKTYGFPFLLGQEHMLRICSLLVAFVIWAWSDRYGAWSQLVRLHEYDWSNNAIRKIVFSFVINNAALLQTKQKNNFILNYSINHIHVNVLNIFPHSRDFGCLTQGEFVLKAQIRIRNMK